MKPKSNFRKMALCAIIVSLITVGCEKSEIDEPGNLVPKTVMEDQSLPVISVNNTHLHSETFGNPSNDMIIILHGGPGGDYRSMLNCKAFADDGYFVVFYDQRGSGLSQRHDKDTYTIQLMLDDLTGVIQYYRTSPSQKVFLVGQSWGGMLATAYVNAYPTSISGLALSEPGGFTWEQTETYLGKTRKLNPFNESTNDVLYPDQILTGAENNHAIRDYKAALSSAFDDAKGVTGNLGKTPFWRHGAVAQSALFKIASNDGFDWTTNLSQFNTKVLFCYSELNQAYGEEHALLLSSAYPNVQLEKIAGSGHSIPYFGWNNYYPLVKEYLNQVK